MRALSPLREPNFRRIWLASIPSNLGQLVLGVAAAWQMTRLTASPEMVALVQTALMLPLTFVAVPAGAIADMFDRRRIAMIGLVFSTATAGILTLLSWHGMAGPWTLLCFCFLIGAGRALFSPSWQASIPEQVSARHLPAAVALGSVSYNVARSIGPALGGLLVVAFGATAVFGVTALLYLPLILAIFLWKRQHVPPRLPPERLDRAIISGARYAIHATLVRTVMIQGASYNIASGAVTALMPLIARDLLRGDARTYGLLLGAVGIGAVIGALSVSEVRERMTVNRALAVCMMASAGSTMIVAFSPSLPLTFLALLIVGAANMCLISLLNVSMQMSVPRWVAARALAWNSSSIAGGVALGAWLGGRLATSIGVSHTIMAAAIFLLFLPLLSRLLPIRDTGPANLGPAAMKPDPEIALALSARSGPILVEVDYRVDPAQARAFYDLMRKVQRSRLRNGAFGWTIMRDLADEALWTEQFQFPTWQDYLRHRDRTTEGDTLLYAEVAAFCEPGERTHVRRRLERPFGSVRWKPETPDPSIDDSGFIP